MARGARLRHDEEASSPARGVRRKSDGRRRGRACMEATTQSPCRESRQTQALNALPCSISFFRGRAVETSRSRGICERGSLQLPLDRGWGGWSRFEFIGSIASATPSRSSTSHTRRSLIALSSPFRWLPKIERLRTKTNIKLQIQKEPATLRVTDSICMEHETRFELAFPSRSTTSHTRHSLIARVSPFRWHALNRKAPTKTNSKPHTEKARPTSWDRLFLYVEHETRFELATLTLAT
jgi:hypothetical protein